MKYFFNIKFACFAVIATCLIAIFLFNHKGSVTIDPAGHEMQNSVKMKSLVRFISVFHLTHNRLPTSLSELTKCSNDQLTCPDEESLRDAWGRIFRYEFRADQENKPGSYKLIYYGADGI